MKKVAFHNLGCKVNSYELDVMRQILQEEGFEEVPFQERADVYVVNTCTVTNIADRKSRQMLHRAKKQNPAAVVIAAGCYVETDPARVEADAAVDIVIGNNKKTQIGAILREFLARREQQGLPEGPKEPDLQQAVPEGPQCPGGQKAAAAELQEPGGQRALPAEPQGHGARQEAPKDKSCWREDISRSPAYEDMQLTDPGHTRAYIKIQDGCNQFCSYCIIPYARGRIRSRAKGEILREVRGLAAGGIREIVLTGIHISSYGMDPAWRGAPPAAQDAPAQEPETGGGQSVRPVPGQGPEEGAAVPAVQGGAGRRFHPFDPERAGAALLDLLQSLHRIEGIRRIRLSSLEPRIMTESFIAGISSLEKVCPHFHLSLQSGCDATLRRMNRHYTTAEYARSVELLRRYYDRPAITTDVIVGFPGETEEEFERTCAFLEEIRFYEIHVFRYSRRSGTTAASMPDQVPEPVKARRSDRLLAMTAAQAGDFRAAFQGEAETLLIEEACTLDGRDYWVGSTSRYVTGAVPAGEGPARMEPGMLVHGRFLSRTLPLSRGPALLFEKAGVESGGKIE